MPTNFATVAWKYFSLTGRAAAAATPPHDNVYEEQSLTDVRTTPEHPTTGRSAPMGRRVEKPGRGRSSGPSGQHDAFNHSPVHTNK